MKNLKLQIGVIGDSVASSNQLNLAYEVGYEIGKTKSTMICGGRGGIMEKAAQGCKESGGLIVGILPSKSRLEGNRYLDIIIPTGMGWSRNSIVALSSDAIIVIGGRSGTLSEISFGWMHNKPIISLNHFQIRKDSWGRKLAGNSLDDRRNDIIWNEITPRGAVERAIKLGFDNIKNLI